MNNNESIAAVIVQSVDFLQDNAYGMKALKDWITWGDEANRHRVLKLGNEHSRMNYDDIIVKMEDLLEEAQIMAPVDMYLYRETSYPCTETPLLIPTTARKEYTGSFGDKHYQVFIPKGTKLFYVSARDLVLGMPNDETEEEFLLAPACTHLVDGILHLK